MTQEEIIQAISDDKMMPFIQPEQLAQIVDFVIKNYKPSLPSNLDEVVITQMEEDGDLDHFVRKGIYEIALKYARLGAEWMAGQGISISGKVGIYGIDVESITEELRKAGFKLGEEVILQIRKKQ